MLPTKWKVLCFVFAISAASSALGKIGDPKPITEDNVQYQSHRHTVWATDLRTKKVLWKTTIPMATYRGTVDANLERDVQWNIISSLKLEGRILGVKNSKGESFALNALTGAMLRGTADLKSVKVMSYNIYRGGTMRGQPLSQTATAIQEAKADVVGVQETKSPRGDNMKELAELLGWNHTANILTRYEIVEELENGIKFKLPSGQQAYVFSLHLPSNPYQPYQLLSIQPKWHKHKDTPFLKTELEAIAAAMKARGREIARLLKQIRTLPDKESPVFVVGDFNEPSHLDWTEEAAKSGRHPMKVEYPNSKAMAKAGFADAYRTLYPDEMKNPGFTWSPMYKTDDPTTHHDRIDFVYFKGKGVKLNWAKVVGENKENADIVISPYPSDHRAVVAAFTFPNQPKSVSQSTAK